MSDSVWATLSAIDCSEHIEDKGGFSYLSWSWAIAMVREHYPDMSHRPLKSKRYPDETLEVRHEVTINGQTAMCWLPVTDYRNKAIANPDAMAINTARMRCLTKCIAVNFGLGFYIYQGDSFPAPSVDLQESYDELLSLVANKKGWELRRFTIDNKDQMDELFNMAPKGKKSQFKSDVRDLYSQTNEALKGGLAALEEVVGAEIPDPTAAHEILSEMEDLERAFVMNGANEILKRQIEELLS